MPDPLTEQLFSQITQAPSLQAFSVSSSLDMPSLFFKVYSFKKNQCSFFSLQIWLFKMSCIVCWQTWLTVWRLQSRAGIHAMTPPLKTVTWGRVTYCLKALSVHIRIWETRASCRQRLQRMKLWGDCQHFRILVLGGTGVERSTSDHIAPGDYRLASVMCCIHTGDSLRCRGVEFHC